MVSLFVASAFAFGFEVFDCCLFVCLLLTFQLCSPLSFFSAFTLAFRFRTTVHPLKMVRDVPKRASKFGLALATRGGGGMVDLPMRLAAPAVMVEFKSGSVGRFGRLTVLS